MNFDWFLENRGLDEFLANSKLTQFNLISLSHEYKLGLKIAMKITFFLKIYSYYLAL